MVDFLALGKTVQDAAEKGSARGDGRPPPGQYREFRKVFDSQITTAGTTRDRSDDGLPANLYRCYKLILRNDSTTSIEIASGGDTFTLPGKSTDEWEPRGEEGDLNIYTVTPDATLAANKLRVVEKCIAWDPKWSSRRLL